MTGNHRPFRTFRATATAPARNKNHIDNTDPVSDEAARLSELEVIPNLPTQKEIWAQAEAIRNGWSEAQRQANGCGQRIPAEIPTVYVQSRNGWSPGSKREEE